MQKILFKRYKQLLSIRINEDAFNPFGKYEFLDLGSKVFAIKRYASDDNESILALFNFTGESVKIVLPDEYTGHLVDIITHTKINIRDLALEPYQIVWLKKHKES